MAERFTDEVTEELKFYVYRLIDPRNGETFYAGKGRGNRLFAHIRDELKLDAEENTDSPKETELDPKLARIRDIRNARLEVGHVVHRHGMDDKTALQVEAALLDAYPGLTNRAGGHGSGDFGVAHASELFRAYSAQPFVPKHRLIAISVSQSLKTRDVYNAVRAAWVIDPKRANGRFVLAHDQGLVVGVFRPTKWLIATPDNFPFVSERDQEDRVRYGFEGVEAEGSVAKEYLNKRIPAKYRRRGAANPVRYIDPVVTNDSVTM